MDKPKEVKFEAVAKTADKRQDLFVVVDGVRIARRGYPNTPHAGAWIPIEPGYEVFDSGQDSILIKYMGVRIH